MYHIYNNPTKFPVSQGFAVRRSRQRHDSIMKTYMKKGSGVVDNETPAHFPLRFSTNARKSTLKRIKSENKRIVCNLLDTKCDKALRYPCNKNITKTNVNDKKQWQDFRQRRWNIYQSVINQQNTAMRKRIQNVKPSIKFSSYDTEFSIKTVHTSGFKYMHVQSSSKNISGN